MPNRLYVGNLPFHATEDLVKEAFAASGEVTAVSIMLDRDTGRSRGFGFVEMATAPAMQKAIDDLNGKDLGGRSLRVSVAEDRKSRGDGGGGGGGGGRPNRRSRGGW